MYIIKDGKFFEQVSNEDILKRLNKKYNPVKLELEDFNFKIDSTNWEIKKTNDGDEYKTNLDEDIFEIDSTNWITKKTNDGDEYKTNSEGDIFEIIEGEHKGEQLFTWERAMRETKKAGKRIPTDEEFNELLTNKDDIKNLVIAGNRSSGTFGLRGYYAFLWSSTDVSVGSSSARGMYLNRVNATVNHNFRDKTTFGFSVRCIKD